MDHCVFFAAGQMKTSVLIVTAFGLIGCWGGISDREQRMLIEISDLQAAMQTSEAQAKQAEEQLQKCEANAVRARQVALDAKGEKPFEVTTDKLKKMLSVPRTGSYLFEHKVWPGGAEWDGISKTRNVLVQLAGDGEQPTKIILQLVTGKDATEEKIEQSLDVVYLIVAQLTDESGFEEFKRFVPVVIREGPDGNCITRDIGDVHVEGDMVPEVGLTQFVFTRQK